MFYKVVFFQMLLVGTTISYLSTNRATRKSNEDKQNKRLKQANLTFKDFLEQYQPRTVWEKLDKLKKSGIQMTQQQELDTFIRGIDYTDEFLKLKVKDGDAKLLIMKDGRRWVPPVGLASYYRDKFSIRRRLFELMKQAIYQARNRMVIMQKLRERFRDKSLYKMGYLMSKTDRACKTFAKFAFRSFRGCILASQEVTYRHRVYDVLASEERALNLLFTVELLVDLIRKNDAICRHIVHDESINNKKATFDERFVD